MKKINKLLLGLGTFVATSAPVVAVVSCGNETQGDKWYGSHRDIVVYESSSNGENPFYGRAYKTITYSKALTSSVLGNAINSSIFGLFKLVKQGVDQFTVKSKGSNNEELFEVTPSGKKVPKTIISSHTNRKSKLAFEAVKAVIITLDDNSQEIFNSDVVDPKNNSSINGNHFMEVLTKKKTSDPTKSAVRDIKFELRDDLENHHWIQQTTGEKGASIKAEDFWTSIQYNILSNDGSRYDLGGSKYIDTYVDGKNQNKPFDVPNGTSPKAYWLRAETTTGLIKSQFDYSGKSSFINGNSIHLSFNGEQSSRNMSKFWKTKFEFDGGLKAMPTHVFEKLKAENPISISVFKEANDPAKALKAYEKSPLGKSGIVQFLATQNEADHYVAGKYYIQTNDKKKLVYKQNNDYIDNKWLNLKNKKGNKVTLNSYTVKFIQKSTLEKSTIQTAFEQGFSATGDIKGMSKENYQSAISSPKTYGLSFLPGYTASKILGDYSTIQMLPTMSNPYKLNGTKDGVIPGTKNVMVFFNNNYSKVLWGQTLSELHINHDTDSDQSMHGKWAEKAFGRTGMQFITNLLAAQNWFTAIKDYKTSAQESTTLLPPEGPITKSGLQIAHKPTEAQFNVMTPTEKKLQHKLRSRWGLDFLDDASHSTLANIFATEVTREQYKEMNTKVGISAIKRYGAPAKELLAIKKNIKEALDVAGIQTNEKVTWEMPVGRGVNGVDINALYANIQKFIRTLDPRLDPVAEMNPILEDGTPTGPEVKQRDYTQSFNLNGAGAGRKEKAWISRLYAGGLGYNVASQKIAEPYITNSLPGGIFRGIGVLQSGFLLSLSYYDKHRMLMSGNDNPLKGLKFWIQAVKDSKATFLLNSSTWEKEFKSSEKQVFIDALKNFKFDELWDNPASVISSYDYAGLNGFGEVRKFATTLHGLTSGDPLQKDLSTFSGLFGELIQNSAYEMDDKINSGVLTDTDLLEAVIALNAILPSAINPMSQVLGNRDQPGIIIKKNWYNDGGLDDVSHSDISWARVDSDVDANGNIIYLK